MQNCSDSLHLDAAALLEHWRELPKQDNLPALSRETELGLDRWSRDLSIVEVHEGLTSFFVRYHGAGTQLRVGDNLTGLYLEDVLSPIVRILALAPYEEAKRTRLPTRSTMTPKLYRGIFSQLDRLVLPFGERDEVASFVTWVGPTEKCGQSAASIYDNLSELTDPGTNVKDIVSLDVLTM